MHPVRAAFALVCASLALASCASATAPGVTPAPAAPATASTTATEPAARPTPPAPPPAPPATTSAPRAVEALPSEPALTSVPEGVAPLSEAEAKELGGRCKPLSDAVVAAARKDGQRKRPIEYVQALVARPPALPGVDVPRCADLLRRDTVAYLARTRESEARIALKRILFGLASALEEAPARPCPTAEPVPTKLETVNGAAYASTLDDWSATGWRCVRFDLVGTAQLFQYELVVDTANARFSAMARGFPVDGQPATELFVEGALARGQIDPSAEVRRRKVR